MIRECPQPDGQVVTANGLAGVTLNAYVETAVMVRDTIELELSQRIIPAVQEISPADFVISPVTVPFRVQGGRGDDRAELGD